MITRHGELQFDGRCLVMGILNVTPDSFSDGGRVLRRADAVRQGIRMVAEGADVIDIGGESTRPGAVDVSAGEQIERVAGVIADLRAAGVGVPISIDTRLAAVAESALDAGADIVNDVSAMRHDRDMPAAVARHRVPFVLMHMQGAPADMQRRPHYDDVAAEVCEFFDRRASELESLGVDTTAMLVDPGLGFGKTTAHNVALLRALPAMAARWAVLVGPSRKGFLGELTGETDPPARGDATTAVVAHCALAGAAMVRVHEVAAARRVVDVAAAIRGGDSGRGHEPDRPEIKEQLA
jgi:dihydropteroate synthase